MGADDKAVLEVGGQPLLDRAIGILTPRVKEVLLACGAAPRYQSRGLRLVLDEDLDSEAGATAAGSAGGQHRGQGPRGQDLRGQGPLVGLAAGLAAATTDWVLLLAADMPFADPAIDGLLDAARDTDDLVHYVVDGYPEPLCALYHRRVLEPLRVALAAGQRRMTCFWEGLSVRALESSSHDPFRNLNTPQDLARARSDIA
jgi:molybdopterin-guanine dinucleotide biosynthesis protein